MSVELSDHKLLDKYGLTHGKESLCHKEQEPIFGELLKHPSLKTVLGGAALNSARCSVFTQKKLGLDSSVDYFGAIGTNDMGVVLSKLVKQSGVNAYFEKVDELTGACAVCVVKKESNRTLCANIGAAQFYSSDHLQKNFSIIENSSLVYSTGFFLTSNFEALLTIAKKCCEMNKIMTMNLSASFIIEGKSTKDKLRKILTYSDFVFCNETEAESFAKTNGIKGNLTKIVEGIAKIKK